MQVAMGSPLGGANFIFSCGGTQKVGNTGLAWASLKLTLV